MKSRKFWTVGGRMPGAPPLDFPLVIAHVCIHNVLTMAAQNKSMVKSVYKMKGAKSSICTF